MTSNNGRSLSDPRTKAYDEGVYNPDHGPISLFYPDARGTVRDYVEDHLVAPISTELFNDVMETMMIEFSAILQNNIPRDHFDLGWSYLDIFEDLSLADIRQLRADAQRIDVVEIILLLSVAEDDTLYPLAISADVHDARKQTKEASLLIELTLCTGRRVEVNGWVSDLIPYVAPVGELLQYLCGGKWVSCDESKTACCARYTRWRRYQWWRR